MKDYDISHPLKYFSNPSEPIEWESTKTFKLIRDKTEPAHIIWACHNKIAIIYKQESAMNSCYDAFLCKRYLHLSLGASAVSVLVAGGLHWSLPWSDPTSQEMSPQPLSQAEAQSDDRAMWDGGDLQEPWCGIMPGLRGWHDIAGVDSRHEWTARWKLAFSPVWKMSRNGIFNFRN